MGKVNCQTVNIEGMRVPAEHVMIELRLPVDGLHAGEIGDPGFRVTHSDAYGLPRAEKVEDWKNTEASLKARLGSFAYDQLTDSEKEVLLRGTPLGHGRYTFLLKVESSGKIRGPEVTVADLKKLGRFSPRAHVYAGPVSSDRVFHTYLPAGEQLDYRSVLGTPVAFDAKKARGASGRPGKRPGKVWDAARGNPEVLGMLLEGISPGSSDKKARIRGTRRANAQQMAWILRTPGATRCVYKVLARAHEALDEWVTDDDVMRWNEEIEKGVDSRHFENGLETYYHTQDKDLDSALRLVRGLADLGEIDPDILTGSMEGETPEMSEALQTFLDMSTVGLSPGNTHSSAPDLIALAAALGYVSVQQAESIRGAAARAALAPASSEEAAFTSESAEPRRLMRIDVRRSKFASNGHYDGDTVRFELLEGMVLLSCPWEDYDLLVKKAGPDADVDAFIRELLGKVKAGHATLVDADTKDDLDPEETLTQMVLAIRVGSMNVAGVLINDAFKRHLGVDPIALRNEMAEQVRKNPELADPEEIIKRWKNAAEEEKD